MATPQDETRYCENCGISFVYTTEEQRRDEGRRTAGEAVATPTHCPGCRALLPDVGRERGMVKWYSPRKRYGFLVRASGGELFLPAASLSRRRLPQTGELVEFAVGERDGRPIAADVRLLAQAATVSVEHRGHGGGRDHREEHRGGA